MNDFVLKGSPHSQQGGPDDSSSGQDADDEMPNETQNALANQPQWFEIDLNQDDERRQGRFERRQGRFCGSCKLRVVQLVLGIIALEFAFRHE